MLADAAREAQGEGDTARVQVLTGRPLAGLRVLVAEDNENNQIVIRDLLQAQGAKVDIAVDGLDTLTSIVANGQYDVILMDWQMPNMDGLEATREIRQIVGFQHIPIIALTANATAADRDTCLAAGMDAHLAKPVDSRQLVLTLLRHARPGTKLQAQLAPAPATAKASAATTAPAPASAGGAPRIEREAAIEKLGGDANLYTTVVERFAKEAPKSVDDMAAALRSGMRKEAHRLAHTLKGNAALIGAIDLSQTAKDAEAAFASADAAGDAKALAALGGVIEVTLKSLAKMA
ncbi:MAG: response regulator, partial [Pseudomonadota bacterium]